MESFRIEWNEKDMKKKAKSGKPGDAKLKGLLAHRKCQPAAMGYPVTKGPMDA